MLTTELFLQLLILFLLLYMVFIKSYFQEKGKNVATKEDIEEITSLVETVKSQLQFSLQARLSLRAEEHQTLIEYFSKYTVWLSAIKNCSAVGITKDNSFRLAEIRSQLDRLHQDFDLAAGKMVLFVENEDIQSQHSPLIIETLNLQSRAEQMTFEIEEVLLEVNQILLNTPEDQRVERYKELLQKQRKIHNQFREEKVQMYKNLLPFVQQQRLAISKHIKILANG